MKGSDVNAKRQKESQEGTMGTSPAAHQTHPSSSPVCECECHEDLTGEVWYKNPQDGCECCGEWQDLPPFI